MITKAAELIYEILDWWKKHQNDCAGNHNLYDEEPKFVTLAKDLLVKKESGQ